MKTVSLLAALCVTVCLVGCENSELINCQQQLDQANTTITEKDNQIEALKTENTEMQTKAMESITVMMQKQAAADEKRKKELTDTKAELNQVKAALANKDNQIKELSSKIASLEKQIAEHKCPVPETAAAE